MAPRWWRQKKEKVTSSSSKDTSSSSTDFSRPCPKDGYYDVFLSFRGEDTRNGFTSYLYHSLLENKVYTFMDVDLTGEDIDYLFKIVEKSRMAVVIYSENFASSDWCLKELEMILQLRKEKKMLMIPIFYKIDVHELKHLIGKTAEFLDKHIAEHGETTVHKWKNVVTRFGNVSGLPYKDTHGRYEYDFIKEVIVKIRKKLQDCGDMLLPHTTTYNVVASAYFQKSWEFPGKLLNIMPRKLKLYVEEDKPSSCCFILTNKTDSDLAFKIQCITNEPLKFSVCPSEGLMLPDSTCQVIVTMRAQSVNPLKLMTQNDIRCDKFCVQSMNVKKSDSYDFSDMFKEESENTIEEYLMNVDYHVHPSFDHFSQLASKGLINGGWKVTSIDTHPTKPWVLLSFIESVCIWNYEIRTEEKSLVIHDSFIYFAKFIREKQWIVVGDRDGKVSVYDYNTWKIVGGFHAHEDPITCLIVHPTLPYVFTTSVDKLIKLWSWEDNWRCQGEFEGHSSDVMQVAFNPKDSSSFASVCADGTIKLWTIASSVAKFTINAHTKRLNCAEYFVGNDDKLYLLSGSDDYSVKVWDYQSKSAITDLDGHSESVMATLVHPKLPIIITGSLDKTIRIWNKNTYRLEDVWKCDFGQIWSMEFIEVLDEIVLGCENGIVLIKILDN